MAMRPCNKCFENNWRYKKVENFIVATCQNCDNEVSWQDKPKVYITKIGQPCRNCNTPVIYKKTRKKAKTYTAYLYCTKCKAMYYSQEYLKPITNIPIFA